MHINKLNNIDYHIQILHILRKKITELFARVMLETTFLSHC
jgi:hypothetical protein